MRGLILFISIVIIILISATGGYFVGTHKLPTIGTSFLTPSSSFHTFPTAGGTVPQNASISAVASPSQIPAGVVATAFYTWYVNCVNHHFQVKSQKSVVTDCPLQNNTHTSTQLVANFPNKISTDPILCAQNTPDSVAVASVNNPTSDTAIVTMAETFGSVNRHVRVSLDLENNVWKITNIRCPGA